MIEKQQFIGKINSSGSHEKLELLGELVLNKRVLDVGCVGQDKAFTSDEWLHSYIRKHASVCHGVDIEVEQFSEIKKLGYEIFIPKELEKLNLKYDIVLISDVIEHVDDPVGFIRYYGKFLENDGRMILSTPNSNAIRNFIQILINNRYSINPQHTCWFCPVSFLEVIDRAGFKPVDFYWLKEYFHISFLKRRIDRIKYRFNRIMYSFRSNFHPNFLYIITKS